MAVPGGAEPGAQAERVDAAGGVVCRQDAAGRIRIAVVHRVAHDDWTLPKGKLEEGERPHLTALREVEEETGLRCEIVAPAGRVAYIDGSGQRKVVTYWVMMPIAGRFRPNDEVDQLRWPTQEEADDLLTYDGDRRLLASLELGDIVRRQRL
jgi:8-oxo-dGTP pyrophosphatase MutT (NUDIX family)